MDREALFAVQQRLSRLITEPSGIEAALAAEADPDGVQLAALVRRSRGLGPADRLAVYANAWFTRLHDCLQLDYGALARALGPAAFHDLVQTYLMVHPPARPSLRHAGADLAMHLSTAPFDEIFSRRCPYAADLARLEWAMAEAFYAADSAALGGEALSAVEADAWPHLRFELTPSLRLVAGDWPVHCVRERFDREDSDTSWTEAPALTPSPTCLRVWRRSEGVRYAVVSRLELGALEAVRAGEPLDRVCEALAATLGDEAAVVQAAALLASWVADGLVARSR